MHPSRALTLALCSLVPLVGCFGGDASDDDAPTCEVRIEVEGWATLDLRESHRGGVRWSGYEERAVSHMNWDMLEFEYQATDTWELTGDVSSPSSNLAEASVVVVGLDASFSGTTREEMSETPEDGWLDYSYDRGAGTLRVVRTGSFASGETEEHFMDVEVTSQTDYEDDGPVLQLHYTEVYDDVCAIEGDTGLADGEGGDGGSAGDGDWSTGSCTRLGDVYSDGIFSLGSFDGALYAGLFGYGHEGESMLYRYPSWGVVSPGLTGISESVCAMREFDGMLYANTESSGDILRSVDGSNWERVYDGADGSIGCGMADMDGWLYAVNYSNSSGTHGRILRSSDGASWSEVYDSGSSSRYLRDIVAHDGVLYAFSVDEGSQSTYQLRSSDGVHWTESSTPARFFRSISWDGDLYIASTDRGGSGPSGIWRQTGSGWEQVHDESRRYVTEFASLGGTLFAGTSDGWKNDSGSSALLMSSDGDSWTEVCGFDEIAAWSVTAHEGQIYVGTWEYGSGGSLYRLDAGSDSVELADCESDPADLPFEMEQGYTEASYAERHNWVLDCRPYAYTASGSEHEPCDSTYNPDGSRTGTATFTFGHVPRGGYDVYVEGRHTENRNSAGALFYVNEHAEVVDQQDESGDYVWTLHGTYCLEGDVEVVLDSTVNSGSDSVSGVRLVPAG